MYKGFINSKTGVWYFSWLTLPPTIRVNKELINIKRNCVSLKKLTSEH